jgi:hypothetical protein
LFCRRRFKRFTKWGKRKGRHGDGQMGLDDDAMSIPPADDHQHTVKVSQLQGREETGGCVCVYVSVCVHERVCVLKCCGGYGLSS